MLLVQVYEARGVRVRIGNGRPGYFIVVQVGKQESETKVVVPQSLNEQSNPVWCDKNSATTSRVNERPYFLFDVDDVEALDVAVSLYDSLDAFQCVGRVVIPVAFLYNKASNAGSIDWYTLKTTKNGKEKRAGDVLLKLELVDSNKRKVCIEDFEPLVLIGKGSFGRVYQVRKIDTGRYFAMKVLSKKDIVARNEVAHTKNEQLILKATSEHPFLVSLKYSFQTESKLYLVMDFINGGELFHHLRAEGRFKEDKARFYSCEVILAIEFLHLNAVIYRDLKPENILLDSCGHIMITDFGLSKQNMAIGVTTHSFCGTSEYLSPEVLLGKGYNKGVDWWTLGILMFEMMVGQTPFYSNNKQEMYHKIVYDPVPFPFFLSKSAESVIAALLHKDPVERLGCDVIDAEEIKHFPYFKTTDWRAVAMKEITPPWRPKVRNSTDVSNVAAEFRKQPLSQSILKEGGKSRLKKSATQEGNDAKSGTGKSNSNDDDDDDEDRAVKDDDIGDVDDIMHMKLSEMKKTSSIGGHGSSSSGSTDDKAQFSGFSYQHVNF